jgi:hypothetical protein
MIERQELPPRRVAVEEAGEVEVVAPDEEAAADAPAYGSRQRRSRHSLFQARLSSISILVLAEPASVVSR